MPDFIALMRDVLDKGRSVRFQVWGTSMTPFIRDGDVITVAPVSAERDIGLGEVVAYLQPLPTGQWLVVHRVVGRRGSSFHIRADYALGVYCLPPVRPEHILGRVVRIERGGKDIRFGLGPERCVIAVLSRGGLLLPLLRHASPF